MLRLTSSSLPLYGRPSTIFFAYASPIPFSAFSSSTDALLRSTGALLLSAALVEAAGALASLLGACALTGETPSAATANSTATMAVTILVMEILPSRCWYRMELPVGVRDVAELAELGAHFVAPVTPGDLQSDGGARRRAAHAAREIVRALDLGALEGGDDVPRLEAGCRRGRARRHLRHERAAWTIEA